MQNALEEKKRLKGISTSPIRVTLHLEVVGSNFDHGEHPFIDILLKLQETPK